MPTKNKTAAKRQPKTEAPVDREVVNTLERVFGPSRVLEKSEIQHHSARMKEALAAASKKHTGRPGYPDAVVFLDSDCELPLACVEVKKSGDLDQAVEDCEHYCSAMHKAGVWCPLYWAIAGDECVLRWFDPVSKSGKPLTQELTAGGKQIEFNPPLAGVSKDFVAQLETIYYAKNPCLRAAKTDTLTREEVENFCKTLNQKFQSAGGEAGGIKAQDRPYLFASFLLCCLNPKSTFPVLAEAALEDEEDFVAVGYQQVDAIISAAIQNKVAGIAPNKFLLGGDEKLRRGFLSILKTVNGMAKPGESFRQVVARIVNSSNLIGDAYEVFHTYTSGSDMGEYFTPRHVVDAVVHLVEHMRGEPITDDDVVYDPACGVGGFLVLALRHAVDREADPAKRKAILKKLGANLFGNEFETNTSHIAKINMLLRGDGKAGILGGSSSLDKHNKSGGVSKIHAFLKSGGHAQTGKPIEPTLVLMNPPFPIKTSDYESYEFIEHALDVAAEGAWIGSIVPEIILNGTDQYAEFRARVLKRACLRASIVIAPDTFEPRASVNTAILILQKQTRGGHDARAGVVFASCPSDGMRMHKGTKQRRRAGGVPDFLSMLTNHWIATQNAVVRRYAVVNPCATNSKAFFDGGEWSPFVYLPEDDAEFGLEEMTRMARRVKVEAQSALSLRYLGGRW